jgi:hypothetical protein
VAKPKMAAEPRKLAIAQAAIFFMAGAPMYRREHHRSLRHQRLSLDLIAGDYKNMGCRGESTSRRGKKVLMPAQSDLPAFRQTGGLWSCINGSGLRLARVPLGHHGYQRCSMKLFHGL